MYLKWGTATINFWFSYQTYIYISMENMISNELMLI